MSTPLVAQKTEGRSGVIVNAEDRFGSGPPEKRARGVSIPANPTRVVLLRNMVGPGEVWPPRTPPLKESGLSGPAAISFFPFPVIFGILEEVAHPVLSMSKCNEISLQSSILCPS